MTLHVFSNLRLWSFVLTFNEVKSASLIMYYHGRRNHTRMTSTAFMGDMPAGVRGRDEVFTEAINQKMRVPDRLRVGPEQRGGAEEDRGRQRAEEPPPAYSMHIPDRLALTGGSGAGGQAS